MASKAPFDCGYFVDSDDECEIEAEAEPWERYAERLYYPVQIGEVLNDRYRIEHKLGWGGHSTVWLAHDAQQHKRVALKIMIAGEGQAEHQIQLRIQDAVQDWSRLILFQSAFFLPSSDGHQHMVLVYPLRGPNLRDTMRETPPAVRMVAAKHILLALKSLHDAEFVHKDLSLPNIMWHIEAMDHWSTEEVYRHLGRPRKVPLHEAHGKPGELVEPIQIPASSTTLPIYLGDFGLTFKLGDTVKPTVQFPLALCAPERLHGAAPNLATDMWSYMYLFLSLHLGGNVIWGNGTTCISLLVGMLGPFPEHWKGSYSGGDVWEDWWWDHSGQICPPPVPLETLVEKIDRRRPDISPLERDYVISLIRRGLCYAPEDRITAAQLVEDPSFNGLMAIYGA
ncbi:hypothetical protein QQS21_004484 [Conoideocrella luteorostrata]|uniref:Protein kinase domain-containing protein n=1 Tax=Conoideocrella luteorostrata TaxID=1105319 RepID=A0AAJ0CU69_9HYPO|nr:hypothetical protein QQS21_004484 [Conoideocrella luteorostrata]